MEKENHGSLGPTCVLKVNLQCCKECPRTVKKQLMQIKGVTDFQIDTEKGLVTVSGVADASILIKAIKKVGRKAELCKFEMQPKHQHEPNCKEARCTCRKNTHDTDSSSNERDVHAGHLNGHRAALGSSVPIPGYHHHPQIAMQGGPAGYFPGPVPPYPHARPYRYESAPPMFYGRPPPPPHPYNYYQPRPLVPRPPEPRPPAYPGELKHVDGPVGNSLVHTFNDLNVNGCTIT